MHAPMPLSFPTHGAAPDIFGPANPADAPEHLERLAERLVTRLSAEGLGAPPVPVLAKALAQRRELARRELKVTLATDPPISAVLRLSAHPDWIALRTTSFSADASIDAAAIGDAIDRGDVPELPLMHSTVVTSMARDADGVLRATSSSVAKPGLVLDDGAADAIAVALAQGMSSVTLQAMPGQPTVTISTDDGDLALELLATGLSDFDNSSPNREHNVFKAINERVHNAVLEPGEKFSLVAALDAPITLAKGWKEEKGLFGGGAALTPGAGICQAATTIYRAALLAGLPVTDKKNHSLFVDHYEFFGVGLDATVFPRVQDLQFKNDTDAPVVLQAYIQGKTVFVSLYGKKDGRSVTLEGPYFASSKERHPQLGTLDNKQIGWVRTVEYGDGKIRSERLVSTYAKPVWRYVPQKYAGLEGMKLLVQRENTPVAEDGHAQEEGTVAFLQGQLLQRKEVSGIGGSW
jgi:vancomycin resistance protein YoaR